MEKPEKHQKEHERTLKADLTHPIDVMENKGRLTMLDGLHRLMKASAKGHTVIKARIHPRSQIPKIASIDS